MKKLMAANWKMYKTEKEAAQTAKELLEQVGNLPDDREVLLIPTFTSLSAVAPILEGKSGWSLGGQNFYPDEEGAFTGEISPGMLKDVGCTYALAGHSERRHVMGEDDAFVARKVGFGLEKGLKMILCIGEKIEQRKAGDVEKVLSMQLEAGLNGLPKNVSSEDLSVAYEPVWAIGTGEVAGEEEITDAHGFVREMLRKIFPEKGDSIRILYGGSVKPDNCETIISLDNVDGVLVGGASLKADSFSRIVLAGI
ncbi:MAG: triose-phosphate isomerase [Desulfovibrionales bacterium]